MKRDEKVARNLAIAIRTMRDACDTAERRVAAAKDDIQASAAVLHAFAWGNANATSHVDTALEWVRYNTEEAVAVVVT
jgi:hypothetical protein